MHSSDFVFYSVSFTCQIKLPTIVTLFPLCSFVTRNPQNLGRNSKPPISWLLAVFCVINLINYVDRGSIASNGVNGNRRTCTKDGTCSSGSGIQGEFNLSNFQDGVISSAFMVGLLVASPIFASFAKRVNPFRLIGVGLTVWTIAIVGCGFSTNFWFIATCRMLVGVGEASFISLAAPFIDDNAPVAQKTAWLGIFYMCIPTGIAFGYVYGGLVGNHLSWRWAFWIEALLMLPFAVLGLFMKPLQLKGFSHIGSKKPLTSPLTACPEEAVLNCSNGLSSTREESKDGSKGAPSNLNELARFWKDLKTLHLEKTYVINVLGYIAYNFVIGAYSYWGPKAGYYIYHMKNADMMFGGITVISGIFGTLAGGFVLDRMTSTISNAFKLLSVATFLGAIFCFAAFCFKSLYAFIPLFAIGELLVFATQGPVNYVCLHSVNPGLRPLAMAMSTVSIHIFGDVPSSPLVGVVQDHINNWRVTALMLTSVLLIAAGIWFLGIFLHSVDRSNEDSDNQISDAERARSQPLLKEKSNEPIEVPVESS
ncbi:probable sphingolipid transporter spinster homolog 2 isoform X2 [Solanum pennellii]|uniref:Probable sphingolipid transporter spinster homolog 2 isoform X2 n=1 Tax=Solanum pennellii TaxID=28526 RepID=A0ABM1VFI0_SOLPN|nr:probable sphingolipid transporter spinster homolog 2 isoform X2 [Solanum pennellii]